MTTKPLYPTLEARLDDIISETSWENWEREETDESTPTNDRFWDICEVLHCKLDHIADWLGDSNSDVEEYRDTTRQVQSILECLTEAKLRAIK
jgi:hypothetical protein